MAYPPGYTQASNGYWYKNSDASGPYALGPTGTLILIGGGAGVVYAVDSFSQVRGVWYKSDDNSGPYALGADGLMYLMAFDPAAGGVTSVNGQTGVVALDAGDIPFTPAGSISAADVQGAIVEVDADLTSHTGNTSNPHSVTKSQVGLANADNTSDVNKPVSTAQAAADAAVLSSANTYADGLVVGLWDDRGNYNASVNTFPASGGSGTAGAILKGDIWTISVAGTLGGAPVEIGDTVRAIVNTPGQTAANWAIGQQNIGYVPENAANKDASGGYAGLTLFAINARNIANTITSFFTNAATVARTWTFPDKSGTVAMTSDITGTNSGTNTGDETEARISAINNAAATKAVMVDADRIIYQDSAASFGMVKATYTNLKAFLKTYFDTLYQPVGGGVDYSTLAVTTISGTPANFALTGINSTDILIALDNFQISSGSAALNIAVSTDNGSNYGGQFTVTASASLLSASPVYGTILQITGLKSGDLSIVGGSTSVTATGTSSASVGAAVYAQFHVGAQVNAIRCTASSGATFVNGGTATWKGR